MKLATMALAAIVLIILVASPVTVYAKGGNGVSGVTSATQTFGYNGSVHPLGNTSIGRHSETTLVNGINLGTISPSTAEAMISPNVLQIGKDSKAITLSFVNDSTTWACASGCAFSGVILNVTTVYGGVPAVACISAGVLSCPAGVGATFAPTPNTSYNYYFLWITGSSVASGADLQLTVSQA